jgi:hypothetical protein
MAGARQHTIPRFLLQGFESSRRGDQFKTWMYRRAAAGVELNIINVGVEKDFYGRELDDKITDLEPEFATLLYELRAVGSRGGTAARDERIPLMVSHFCLRTRRMLQATTQMAIEMVSGLRDRLGNPKTLEAILRRDLDIRLQEWAGSNGVDDDRLNQIRNSPQISLEGRLSEAVGVAVPQVREALDMLVAEAIKRFPSEMKRAYLSSMAKNIEDPGRAECYAGLSWFVVTSSLPLILGDTVCVFETRGKRRFKPLDSADDDLVRVYFPLSSNQLLVGTSTRQVPEVDVGLVNKAAARCSFEYFVCSANLPPESMLSRGLGLWSGLLSRGEIEALLNEVEGDMRAGRM